MLVKSKTHAYEVGAQVADSGKYRLYLCRQDGTDRQGLLQIATDVKHNGALQRGAFFLRELKERSDELEAEYAKIKDNPKHFLNYDLGFPELVDSFVCQEQGGRQINILALRGIADLSRMVPITNITTKDRRRVDARTSAWIMGKSLKLLSFVHDAKISVGRMDGNNILIEPDEHYVVILDWSEARTSEAISRETRVQDISQAVKAVVTLLGGNTDSEMMPDDVPEAYARVLLQFTAGIYPNAATAHQRFYELIDQLWERKFYPFTTQAL